MSVHCDKCGYENDLQHSFCGMCGTRLPVVPVPVAVPASQPAHQGTAPKTAGSSILGLADEPTEKDRVSYLLEEVEAPPKHRGRYVLLAILVAGLGLAAWHWRQDLILARLSSSSNSGQTAETGTAPAVTPGETPPSATAETPAATSATPSPATEQPKAGSGSQAPGTTPAPTQPETAGQTDTQTPAASAAAAPPPAPATEAPPAASSAPAKATPAAEVPEAKAPSPEVKPATPTSPAESLETKGERYLYGNGVPVDCGLAQRNLQAAAKRANAKAQSVLGTMYATGHCVNRDLPVAYGWFAKALHQDPGNTRYEQDLKVLWRQMTDAERKVALQGQ